MSTLITRRAAVALAAAGALLTGALAVAPQAGATTYYACVKASGNARIYTKKPKCKKHETKLSWNSSGPAGANGANGKNGTNGTNGTNGANGANGAVGGFATPHMTEGVAFTTATEESPKTIVSKTLPAGNFIANAKVEVLLSDTKTGGFANVQCRLVDTPSGGGGTSFDSSGWATLINFPFIFVDLAQNTLPLTLAIDSPSHASTLSVVCWVGFKEASGGIFVAEAVNAGITAVQTTVNG
jgi:hypothetical protein